LTDNALSGYVGKGMVWSEKGQSGNKLTFLATRVRKGLVPTHDK